MSQMVTRNRARTGAAGTKGKLQSTAAAVTDKTQEVAEEATGQVRSLVSEQTDIRSTQVGERVQEVASALDESSVILRDRGQEGAAQLVEQITDKVERAGNYLVEFDGAKFREDFTRLGRGRPVVLGAACAVLGFAAARFLKASGSTPGGTLDAGSTTELSGSAAGGDFRFGRTDYMEPPDHTGAATTNGHYAETTPPATGGR
jgi:hypothetical protein